MKNQNNLVFTFNKSMYVRMIIGFFLFGGLAGWLLVFKPHNYIAQYIFMGLGIVCALLAVWLVGLIVKKMNGPKEGIIVTKDGIIDNVGVHKIPLILWKDVKGIKEEAVAMNKFVRIDVWNPDEYIQQGETVVGRRMMKNNFKMYGSPFMITSQMLNVKHKDLLKQLTEEFAPYKAERAAKKAEEKALREGTIKMHDDEDII